jgi:phage recombination protein Bet
MTQAAALATQPEERSLTATMAEKYGMSTENFLSTMKKTVMPSENVSNEHIAAFMLVAKEYDLNPFTEEIHAFPSSKGGIKPQVGIDGWITIANRYETYNGLEHIDDFDKDGNLISVTGIIYRKDQDHPTKMVEYMDECRRDTKPWNQYPKRMLRHKAIIQAIRMAFGIRGIYDKDELERMEETEEKDEFVPLKNVTPPVLKLSAKLDPEGAEKPKPTRSRKKAEPKITEPEPGILVKEVGSEEVDKLFTRNIDTKAGQVEFTVEEEEI